MDVERQEFADDFPTWKPWDFHVYVSLPCSRHTFSQGMSPMGCYVSYAISVSHSISICYYGWLSLAAISMGCDMSESWVSRFRTMPLSWYNMYNCLVRGPMIMAVYGSRKFFTSKFSGCFRQFSVDSSWNLIDWKYPWGNGFTWWWTPPSCVGPGFNTWV